MAEATEELIKIFLEQKGYLVTLSKRINVKTSKYSPRAEVDVIAVRIDGPDDGLPDRIAGEVKSYDVSPRGFKALDTQLRKRDKYTSREEYGRFKWVNNKKYRSDILKSLNKEYKFKDFEYVLFCNGVTKKYEPEIKAFLKKENIGLITHKFVIEWLFKKSTSEYTDNQILQVIRLIKKNSKKIEF